MPYVEMGDGTHVHVTSGPEHVATLLEDVRQRWCFRCRRRTTYRWVVYDDLEPSYYPPLVRPRCDGCGEDGSCFPGTYREYDDA